MVQQIGSNFSAPSNLEGLCGVEFRSLTAGCEAVTCSANDIQQTMLLAKRLCGNLYEANATLSSSVSAAVSSATSAALAATQGKDVTDISNYPQCVVSAVSSRALDDHDITNNPRSHHAANMLSTT